MGGIEMCCQVPFMDELALRLDRVGMAGMAGICIFTFDISLDQEDVSALGIGGIEGKFFDADSTRSVVRRLSFVKDSILSDGDWGLAMFVYMKVFV